MKKISKKTESPEFGFGSNTTGRGRRLLNPDGTSNVVRIGEPKFRAINIYHSLISMSWLKFNSLVITVYILVNFLFAFFYELTSDVDLGGTIYSTAGERFMEEFFFSAQTLSTVGYGRLNPIGIEKSALAAVESMVGLMGFALITGLLYGRFSRPTAKLIFSRNALIAPFNEGKAFMFRIVNARRNQLIEVDAQIAFSYNEEVNGRLMRRFQLLKLEISHISILAMTWTIVHPIDGESPLFGLSEEDLSSLDAEFIISIKAMDDTYAQQVFNRSSYKWNDLIWNAKFISAIGMSPEGVNTVDLGKINEFEVL